MRFDGFAYACPAVDGVDRVPVTVEQDEGGDAFRIPQLVGEIDDNREGETAFLDDFGGYFGGAFHGENGDEGNLVRPLFGQFLESGETSLAGGAPVGPEENEDWTPPEFLKIEAATTQERSAEDGCFEASLEVEQWDTFHIDRRR